MHNHGRAHRRDRAKCCNATTFTRRYLQVDSDYHAATQQSAEITIYIVAIGWLYVTVLMAFTETGIVAGAATFVFYGLLPVALLMWLGGTRMRRRRRAADQQGDEAP